MKIGRKRRGGENNKEEKKRDIERSGEGVDMRKRRWANSKEVREGRRGGEVSGSWGYLGRAGGVRRG